MLRRVTNEGAVGFGDGAVVLELGRDNPSYKMDPSGKLVDTSGSEGLIPDCRRGRDARRRRMHTAPPRELEANGDARQFHPTYSIGVVGNGVYIVIIFSRGVRRRLDLRTVSPEPMLAS